MENLSKVIYEIHEIDEMAARKTQINQVHPLGKLLVTVLYIVCVVSFHKYDIIGILPFAVYPLIMFALADIPIKKGFRKLRIILPLVCFVGVFNPFFDHLPMFKIGTFIVTGGMISMVTLIIKGIFALLASFLLIATTGIEKICHALRLLHIPNILVTQILLTYRYITVLLSEANAVVQAYSLRAPGEKGVKYKIWGSLIGQLLLRSIDRAGKLYDSMLLRGFQGEYYYLNAGKFTALDYVYLFVWISMLLVLRLVNITGMFTAFI